MSMQGNEIYNRLGKVPLDSGFRQEGFHIWGSSVIKGEDGRYHMFATRVPAYMKFHPGWMIASEIVRASADNPLGPYTFEEVVLPARGAEYWDGCSTHNPKIVKIDGKYLLYYMGSTHPYESITPDNASELTITSKWALTGRANKRVGIAVSDSVFGPWKREDKPILPVKTDTFYSFLTSNPSPCFGKDGKVYLMFKARQYLPGPKTPDNHSSMMIGMAVADNYAGPYRVISDKPLFSDDTFGEVEDPFMWCDDRGFHMLAKDQNGKITGQHGFGLLAHSSDALNWELDENPLAYAKKIVWENGEVKEIGNMERCCGMFSEDNQLTHLTFAIWEDPRGFGCENSDKNAWNMVVPLT